MRDDQDLLVVGFDLHEQREVHIGERPLGQWRALGYGRAEQVVCFYCFHGFDAPAGTRVPLLARGRIGGLVRPHFAHPSGTAPVGGHHPETVWHITAKHCLARWAEALPNTVTVRLEQWTRDRDRRADIWVELDDGSRLALEAQRELITDERWQARHRDYAREGIQDVWFLRPRTRIPHVLFSEGIPAWTLLHRSGQAEARLGQPHPRRPQWWNGDLRHYAPHHPPCPGDPVHTERFVLADLGLDHSGVTFPPALVKQLAEDAAQVRREAVEAKADFEKTEQRRRQAVAQRTTEYRRYPQRPTPPPRSTGYTCLGCGGPLDRVLARIGRHFGC